MPKSVTAIPAQFVLFFLLCGFYLSGRVTEVRDNGCMSVPKLGHGYPPFCCEFSPVSCIAGNRELV